MRQALPNKAAYVYFHDNKPSCWLYCKLSPDKLKSALPLDNTNGKTHLTAFFVDYRDYLGCSEEKSIEKLIDTYGEININEESEPTGIWNDKYRDEFYSMKDFLLNQLNDI
tara:strand:- start:283 stop:615 length:333 start_codon:yes stop_codon:yes gene_type:complete